MSQDATVFTDIAAEVEIPQDGTLSRVLYKDERIRLVVFAFDAGQELTEHTASVPAVIQVVRGRFDLTLGDEEVTADPSTWIRMPANLPHSVRAVEPSVMLLTMLPEASAPTKAREPMGFRLANINDRAVLVDGDSYYDVENSAVARSVPIR